MNRDQQIEETIARIEAMLEEADKRCDDLDAGLYQLGMAVGLTPGQIDGTEPIDDDYFEVAP